MSIPTAKCVRLAMIGMVFLMLTACDPNHIKWRMPNMTALTPRLQPMFEKTKHVCFGRFMIEVPASATVAWGETVVPLTVNVYPNGLDMVKGEAQKFIDELKSKKAIYQNNVPLLLKVDDIDQPEGKIVTGYEDFESIDDLKVNGYFRLNNDGVIINARPMRSHRESAVAIINSIARRLRQHTENEVPTEPGNCIESAFLPDSLADDKEHTGEFINIGFRLKEFPDAHVSVEIRPSNYNDPESDSLKKQWKRVKEDPATPEEKAVMARVKYFRENSREIGDWKTGYEVLTRSPDEEGVHSFHDFEVRFTGVGHDPYKPYASIQMQTGVADNAAGATKTDLTDEEAIAIWDKITSTIRVRPTSAAPVKSAADGKPRLPLGELAATGRTCPQTGWWQASEAATMEAGGRRHIQAGEHMPHVTTLGEPSMWQKIKQERPSYRTATVWKLVGYDDATPRIGAPAAMPAAIHTAFEDAKTVSPLPGKSEPDVLG